MSQRIGIFSGTFDPVHGGHIAFALEALNSAKLDKIYFLPEAVPRRKEAVTHYAHRLAMLKLALRPYRSLGVLELPDKQFSVNRTLPRLNKLLPDADLHLLIGTDMLELLSSGEVTKQWPDSKQLLDGMTLVVGVRSAAGVDKARLQLKALQPAGIIVKSERPHVSSREIRQTLMSGGEHQDLLVSLKSYVAKHWLYVTVH